MDELVEERPVPGAVVRHRGARMEEHGAERSAPRLEVHAGAVWIRATEAGPGLLVSHGATTVQVREGAAVLEVSDFEALLVVVAGRAAVKGAAALPRSVTAGHAVVLHLDGGFGSPEPLTPEELRADRFVVENLARDVLAEGPLGPEVQPGPRPVPAHDPSRARLTAPAGARVDGSPPLMGEAPAMAQAPMVPEEPQPPAAAPTPDAGPGPDPDPVVVPGLDPSPDREQEPRPPVRRGLVAVVVALVLLAAIIGALVLTGDEARSAPSRDTPTLPSTPVVATTDGPEAHR